MNDNVIFFTGAFGLIGLKTSVKFLQDGYRVVLADINGSLINEILCKLTDLNISADRFQVVRLDITNRQTIIDALDSALKLFGRVDVLINNAAIDAKFDVAGIGKIDSSRFEDYPFDLIRKSVEVNTLGTIEVTQVFCKMMMKQGFGNIINVASTYALLAPNQSLYEWGQAPKDILYKPVDYVVSKSFLPNFTRYIATFYGKNNIRCNALAPHGIFNDHQVEFLENFSRLSPIGRMCEVDEVYGAFRFLASDESKYMTGSTLVIDGGWSAW
jgi:NAD(P)-dependent dehydrogenase (short-subunit alcohol dehydrogenase family)